MSSLDAEKMGGKTAEYSRLNNLSSSGDEVEQFALPAKAVDERPKRRRKRKDFDLLKAHAIVKNRPFCSCFGCTLLVVVVVLIASVCGVTYMFYGISQNMADLRNKLEGVSAAGDSRASELQRHSQMIQSLTSAITAVNTLNKTLANHTERMNHVDQTLAAAATEPNQLTVKNELGSMQSQIATFGSKMDSLQLEVDSLKQSQTLLTQYKEIVDGLVNEKENSRTSTFDMQDVQKEIATVTVQLGQLNDTWSSRLGTFNDFLSKLQVQYGSFHQELTSVSDSINMRIANLTEVSASMFAQAQVFGDALQNLSGRVSLIESFTARDGSAGTMLAVKKENVSEIPLTTQTLMDRVDRLESYVHDVSSMLNDRIVADTESKVVNLTITTGMEDIISRTFITKFGKMKDTVDNLQYYVGNLDAEIKLVDQRVNTAYQQLFTMHQRLEQIDSTKTSATAIVTAGTPVTVNTTDRTVTFKPGN